MRQGNSYHTDDMPVFRRLAVPLFQRRSGRYFGGISKCIVSYDDRVATKWRHCLDRKAWTQNAKTFRCKRKENDHEHCCTFHVSGFYPDEPPHDKEILTTLCGSKSAHRYVMDRSDGRGLSDTRSGARILYSLVFELRSTSRCHSLIIARAMHRVVWLRECSIARTERWRFDKLNCNNAFRSESN